MQPIADRRISATNHPTSRSLFINAIHFLLLIGLFGGTSHAFADQPPNFVLIFVDDMGWGDVGCYGNEFVDTPHIDQLAADGIRFTDFYASGPTCSPTRCALQSGQNQARIGITSFIPGHWRPFEKVITPPVPMALRSDIVTIGEAMKEAGYTTGYFGKWHLGSDQTQGPQHQGYDEAVTIGGPSRPTNYRVTNRKDIQVESSQYRSDFEADLTTEFIAKNSSQPFFAMVSPFNVHIPLTAMSDKVKKYRERAIAAGAPGDGDTHVPHPVYAAMIEHIDDLTGRIVEQIEASGITGRTMILFTSDNGGLRTRYDFNPESDPIVSDLAPLRGEKGALYEGGIRVPLIVKFPNQIPAGQVCREVAVTHDFFPTLLDFADGELPQNQTTDGVSLRPVFESPESQLTREQVFFHHPHYHHSRPASAIRTREWKLIEFLDNGDLELYAIQEDIGESKNLASTRTQVASQLRRKLDLWRREVVAAMPLANPAYDSKRADQWFNRRTGKSIAQQSASRKPFPRTEP
ncbi:MAG: sulfatase [Planctomycetota bacterium]